MRTVALSEDLLAALDELDTWAEGERHEWRLTAEGRLGRRHYDVRLDFYVGEDRWHASGNDEDQAKAIRQALAMYKECVNR